MGRSLRLRRREPLASMAGIVSTEPDHGVVNFNARVEIGNLRAREQAWDEVHLIADFVSTYLISVNEITNPVRMGLYRAAMERFTRLPRTAVREFVDAAIEAEKASRKGLNRLVEHEESGASA